MRTVTLTIIEGNRQTTCYHMDEAFAYRFITWLSGRGRDVKVEVKEE